MKHISVLLNETIENLNVKPDGIYVDGTLGRAGHSSEILKRLTSGRLIGFDKDEQALAESRKRLEQISNRFTLVDDDFRNMKQRLHEMGIEQVDGILLDIGVSSPQFDDGERGFSYRYDAPLDMRMNRRQELTAAHIVNTYSFHELQRILKEYGEEKFAKQIARKIESARQEKPIETTFELVDIIKSALPMKALNSKGHPAKQTFQALRIEVNGELDALKQGIRDAMDLLNENGRLCVITFHSLEDRIVKTMFNEVSSIPKVDKHIPLKPEEVPQPDYRLISRKPILASEEELAENNRAHSAKLRVLEREKKHGQDC